VQLNHYPLGAVDSYVLKADRGRAVHSDDLLGLDYWVERNLNEDEDLSAQPIWDRAQPFRDAFAADPVLGDLHAQSVAWRKDRFRTLMEQDRFRDLYGRLLMCGSSRPIPPDAARMLTDMALRAMHGQTGDNNETP
jgi:hypothetical protein